MVCTYLCSVGTYDPGEVINIRSRSESTAECSCICSQVTGQASAYKINDDGCGYRNENAVRARITDVDNVSEYSPFYCTIDLETK